MSTRSGRSPRRKVTDADSNTSESPQIVTKSSLATNARKDKSPKGSILEGETSSKDESPARTTRRTAAVKDASPAQSVSSPRSPGRARGVKSGNAESSGEPEAGNPKSNPRILEVKEKKNEESTTVSSESKTGEGTSAPSTPVAGVRRSGRAPVPSSKYKDMEVDLGSSRKRASAAVATSEGSDAEPEPPKKRGRKTSERSQTSTVVASSDSKASDLQGESSEEQTESQSAAEISEDENVPLSIEEMIHSNLSEAGLEKEKETKKDAGAVAEVQSTELGNSNEVVEVISSKQTEPVEVSKEVAIEETIVSSPIVSTEDASIGTESEQLTLPSKDMETVTLVSLLPTSESSIAVQERGVVEARNEEPTTTVSMVDTQPKVTEKSSTATTNFSDLVTINQTIHGHVMPKNIKPPFATVVTEDGTTYLNLSVEATTINKIMKGKHLPPSQKPSNRVQGHGRVLRNPSGTMIVKTSLVPPPPSVDVKEEKEVPDSKPAAPYSLLYPKRKPQSGDSVIQKGTGLPGSIKSSSQGNMPQRVVVVRPADSKMLTGTSTSTLVGVAQAASKALGEARLGESSPTVIRVPQDLPSKRNTPTIVHVQTSPSGPVASAEAKQTPPAAPKTASEILIQRLREQQKRVIIKEAVHTADEMVRESQMRQAENAVGRSETVDNQEDTAQQQTNIEEAAAEQTSTAIQETSGESISTSSDAPRKKISVLPCVLSKDIITDGGSISSIQRVTDSTQEASQSTVESSQSSVIEDGLSVQDSSQIVEQTSEVVDGVSDPVKVAVEESSETSRSELLTELTNVQLTDKANTSEGDAEVTFAETVNPVVSKYAASLQAAATTASKDKERVVEKIRIVDNGIEYDVSIVSEEDVAEEIIDNSTGQLVQDGGKESNIAEVEPEIMIKQEVDEDVVDIKPDIEKHTSGTQTVYSPRLQTVANPPALTSSVTHKLATVVDDGREKKHVYYVSVIPNKGIMNKSRTTVTHASWVMGENGMFCCERCDYETDRKANFYKHRRSHSGFKPHVCSVCQYKAGTSSNLKRHMGIHRDIREHKCNICGLCFRQKIHLERHIKYKHEEKSIKCPMCDYICANEQPDLKMHIKRKHSNENAGEILTCPECKVRVGNRKDLKQHMKFHKEGPELKLFCKECSFVTDCQSRLKRHTAIHSKQKPFQCGVCNYRAAQKEHVLRHLRTQHKIEIKKDRKRPWRRHKKVETVDSLKERADFSSGDKIFACNHCTMRFAKLINLYKHLHTQHSDIMPPETDGNFYCVVCEYSTTNKKNLLVHMRRHNMADQTPPTHVYSCVLCRYVNPKRRNLFQHMRKKHNINISKQTESYLEGEDETEGQELEVSEVISSVNKVLAPNNNNATSPAAATVSETSDSSSKDPTGDLAGVANMIKIEDLTRTSTSGEVEDIHTLVIDSSRTSIGETAIHTTAHSADALEGLQALAEQAGLIDNIIEEQVPVIDENQTVIIEQGGTATEIVGNVEVVDGQFQQVIQVADAPAAAEASEGLELTEEQLSSLRTGDMVEMEGELYMVELTQDPNNPNKQLLSFLPVTQVQTTQEPQS